MEQKGKTKKIETLDEAEKRLMRIALNRANYNVEKAHKLNCPEAVPFMTLRNYYRKINKYQLNIDAILLNRMEKNGKSERA